jgi:radical SAM-linked protein
LPHPQLPITKLLFSFTKEGSAVFHGHLSLIEIFSMAMCRAGLEVQSTQGVNPLVKMEIVAPLSIGISAEAEIASVDFSYPILPAEFKEKINVALPEGLIVNRSECYKIPVGEKKHSLSSLLWGFGYGRNDNEMVYVPAASEKYHRNKILEEKYICKGDTVFSLRRACVLAKNIIISDESRQWASYFDVYSYLY